MASTPARALKKAAGFSIVWGVLLIVCGVFSIVMPVIGALAVAVVVAWLLIFGGIAHFAIAFQTRGAGHFLWQLLLGALYIFCGGYLLVHPAIGVASLTLLLAAFFLAEGILELVAWSRLRTAGGSGWLLFDGIVTLILAILIWLQWPASSAWAIGTIVGIGLLFSGIARTVLAVKAREAIKSLA